jgi:hypothetical protein
MSSDFAPNILAMARISSEVFHRQVRIDERPTSLALEAVFWQVHPRDSVRAQGNTGTINQRRQPMVSDTARRRQLSNSLSRSSFLIAAQRKHIVMKYALASAQL